MQSSQNKIPHVSHSLGLYVISLQRGHFTTSFINDISFKFNILSEGIPLLISYN